MANAHKKYIAVFASASRAAATYSSNDFSAPEHKGVRLIFNTTVGAGTSNIVTVQGKDPVSGSYYGLTSTPITGGAQIAAQIQQTTGTGIIELVMFPDMTTPTAVPAAASSGQFNLVVPRVWRVQAVVSGSAPTFSIHAELIP